MASSGVASRHFLITGVPGVGKTTLMMKLHQELVKHGHHCSGFVTEEVRMAGRRHGFDVVTMDGQRAPLARVTASTESTPAVRHRGYVVGQYTVDLLSFEQAVLPCLRLPGTKESTEKEMKQIFLIDEIGKMEMFSQSFVQAVRRLTSQPDIVVVATIPVSKGKPIPFVEELRSGACAVVFEVTRQNRDTILSNMLPVVIGTIEK